MTKAQDTAKNIMDDAQANVKSAFEKFGKSVEEMNVFAKDNFEAVNKASEVSAKAAEIVSKEILEISKKNFDEGVKAAQEIAASKNPNEMMEKQAAFAKTAFETYTQQATALADMFTKTGTDVFAPINERVQAAGDLVKNAQA